MVTLISTIAKNGALDLHDDKTPLPWINKEAKDFLYHTTHGQLIITGRHAYEQFPDDFLKYRSFIVLSRKYTKEKSRIFVAHNIQHALSAAKRYWDRAEPFICGGARIYKQMLPRADKLLLTHLESSYRANVYFPRQDLETYEKGESVNISGGQIQEYLR